MEEKIKNIKILLNLNGGTKSYEDSAKRVINAVKHLIPNYKDENFKPEYLEEILEDIQNQIIPIYDKYFTNEEIIGIIEFYNTLIGQAYLSKMGIVALESMQVGNKYGELIYNKLIEMSKENEFYMKKEEFVERWNKIPNKHVNYNKIEVVGENEILNHFTIKELNYAEKMEWLYNNHADYDGAEPSYNLK
jgi:hypothetical protein